MYSQIGPGLVLDWQIGPGFELSWKIGAASASCVSVLVALTAWEIVHRGDTSVGPHSTLVPRLYAQLSSDWHIIGMICVNAWQCPANR